MFKKKNILLMILTVFTFMFSVGIVKADYCPGGWQEMTDKKQYINRCCPPNSKTSSGTWSLSMAWAASSSSVGNCRAETTQAVCSGLGGTFDEANSECTVSAKAIVSGSVTSGNTETVTYTATFKPMNGSAAIQKTCKASTNGSCTISPTPSVTKTDYYFDGWVEMGGSCSNANKDFVRLSKNTTFTACYTSSGSTSVNGSSSSYNWNAKFYPNGGTWSNGSTSGKTFGPIGTKSASFSALGAWKSDITKSGYYLSGWYSKNQGKTLYSSIDYTTNNNDELTAVWASNKPTQSSTNVPAPDLTVTEATVLKYYTITYVLDGGQFIDGTTSRTEVLSEKSTVGEMDTNPVKEGYKFLYWKDSNGNKFNFDTKLTSDVTLTAVYEPYENSGYLCEEEDAIFDPSTNRCYTYLKTDNSTSYNYTLFTYAAGSRWCYAYHGDESKPGARHFKTGVTPTTTGKQGQTDGVYEGWGNDAWLSENTCKIASACTVVESWDDDNAGSWDNGCEIKWSTILYKYTSPILVTIPDDAEDDGQGGSVSDKTDQEASGSPKTGDALIYMAWAATLGAVGYSIYYFRNKKKKELEIQ